MKNKIIVFLFIGYIFIFSILGIVIPDKDISNIERRKLAEFPTEFDSELILDVDKYFLDHFVLRDELRGVKSRYNYHLMRKLDNNGIYLKDNYIFKSNYPTNKDSIYKFNKNIFKLSTLLTDDNNTYMMVIPDKNYYLKDDNFLHIDYEYIYKEVLKFGIKGIDIRDVLELSDYYETDTHWRQEKLDKVIKSMSKVMDFSYEDIVYEKNTYDKFYGVYYGEAAVDRKSEKLVYLTSEMHNDITVDYLENKSINSIYNVDKLNGLDAYDVYLDGASSFIEIYNPNSTNEKELVVFRDSFGSSLIPLLVNYYKKITVIDNRYISSENFKKMITFDDQDILFMYSTLLINDSGSLKG